MASRSLPRDAVVVLDARVDMLHPNIRRRILERKPSALVAVEAGERSKSFRVLEQVVAASWAVSRGGTLVAIGGGTVGDVCTVAAHLVKRGVALIHVPTTALAAIDSSVGGKGAIHAQHAGRAVKNAAGVFHYPVETWLCQELWDTLSLGQLREGALEAWKMAACLSAGTWRRYRAHRPSLVQMVREARSLKSAICEEDPYEQSGERHLLNFGHTFGHVLESVSRFRLSHGDAVGLGMRCALDVGRALGVTPQAVGKEVEEGLDEGAGALSRSVLGHWARRQSAADVAPLLRADKKRASAGELRMVLLERLGAARTVNVPSRVWRPLWRRWAQGEAR